MAEQSHTLGPSSPTVQEPVKHREAEDEKQPLLGSVEARQSGFQRQNSIANVVKHMKHPSTWNWRNLIAVVTVWLAYGFVDGAYSVIGPFFPNEALGKGSSPTTTGIIISASPLCVAIFSPLVGYLLPTLGLKFTLVSGLLLVGGPFVLLGFTSLMPSGWVFILFCVLLRMTEGVGSAMLTTAAFALLPELFPNHVGTLMGLFEVAGGLGFAIGPPIGGLLYAAGGFKLPFIAVGGAVLVFVPLTFLLVGNMSYSKRETVALKAILKFCSSLRMIILVLANLLALAALGFFTPSLQPFLTTNFHLTPEQVGLVFLSGPLCCMFLSLVAGQLSDKFGPRWFIVFGFIVCGIGFAFVGPADFIRKPTLWITVVAYGVVGVGVAFGTVPIYSDILAVAKSMNVVEDDNTLNAIVSGITSSSLSFGEFLGPLIGGVLLSHLNFQDSGLIFGEVLIAEAFLLLGASLIDLYFKKRSPH